MFIVGDIVEVQATAEVDVCSAGWPYISAHPRGRVKHICHRPEVKPEDCSYVIEWDEDFAGGHTCGGAATPRRGQFVSGKHLLLNFEETWLANQKEIVTVPNLGMTIDEQGDGMPKVQE